MKKQEIYDNLKDRGYDEHEFIDLNWIELKKFYSQVVNKGFSSHPTTQQDVEERIERQLTRRELDDIRLKKERDELIPKIKDFIKSINGKVNLSGSEISTMYNLYNKFYKRHDTPGCSICMARIYNALKKISG